MTSEDRPKFVVPETLNFDDTDDFLTRTLAAFATPIEPYDVEVETPGWLPHILEINGPVTGSIMYTLPSRLHPIKRRRRRREARAMLEDFLRKASEGFTTEDHDD